MGVAGPGCRGPVRVAACGCCDSPLCFVCFLIGMDRRAIPGGAAGGASLMGAWSWPGVASGEAGIGQRAAISRTVHGLIVARCGGEAGF